MPVTGEWIMKLGHVCVTYVPMVSIHIHAVISLCTHHAYVQS
jgi:hypothetical protein